MLNHAYPLIAWREEAPKGATHAHDMTTSRGDEIMHGGGNGNQVG